MKFSILNGIKTYAPNSRDELIDYAVKNKSTLIAVNTEKILHAGKDTQNFINQNIGYPDGIGAVWLLRKKGHNHVKKIPGCELWLNIISRFYRTKSFYLIGGEQKVIDQTVVKLKKNFDGINILNHRNGFFENDQQKIDLSDDIKKLNPDFIFVAMGSPIQENLIKQIQKYHHATFMGLGGSFDVYTGNVKRAPKWWVENNLEWAYRLINEPYRIKRQVHLIKLIPMLIFEKSKQ